MFVRRKLLAGVSAFVLMGLAACQPTSNSDADADFFVASAGMAGTNGYTVQGWGWKPGANQSVQIWHEPTGPGSVLSEWKEVFKINADSYGMFGFTGGGSFYPVQRKICGAPPQGQFMLVMVKSETGRIRIRQVAVDLYFTFQPCG